MAERNENDELWLEQDPSGSPSPYLDRLRSLSMSTYRATSCVVLSTLRSEGESRIESSHADSSIARFWSIELEILQSSGGTIWTALDPGRMNEYNRALCVFVELKTLQ
jgi:hypothetical protein